MESANKKPIINEQKISTSYRKKLINEFIVFCIKELKLQRPINCKVRLTTNKKETDTYAHFDPNNNKIVVYIGDRGIADSLRSLSHEIIHMSQRQQGKLKPNSGETGSSEENEANAKAGVLMRNFGKIRPEIYRYSS